MRWDNTIYGIVKIKYLQKKLHAKKRGPLYKVFKQEIKTDQKGGIMHDITNLCNKYDLPNVQFHWIKDEHINAAVQSSPIRYDFYLTQLTVSFIHHFQSETIVIENNSSLHLLLFSDKLISFNYTILWFEKTETFWI